MLKKSKIIAPIIVFVIAALIQYFGVLPGALDNAIHDNIMVSAGTPSDRIIIVGIDQRSINEIGTWPFPRYFMAEAVERLTDMGAAAIGINVLYDTIGAVPEHDEAFVTAAQGTNRLVLGADGIVSPFQDISGLLEIEYLITPFTALNNHVRVGALNADLDDADSVLRNALAAFRYGDITVNSFPFEVYRTFMEATGQTPIALADIPLDDMGRFPIRYIGGPQTFRAVSLWGVINDEYPAALFRDAIVLIGPYAQGIGDGNATTPLERGIQTHGIELFANIVQNFVDGNFLSNAHWLINLLILTLCAIIVILLAQKVKPITALVATLVLIALLLVGARLAYDQFNTIISVGDTILFLGVCYLVNLTLSILTAQNDRQQIKEQFGRFVAPEVVSQILSGDIDIQLGGVIKNISALFVDIRGFTAFSEANPPEKVVDMVNMYLELTSTSIQRNNGTIDKFIGDATMALFNAPNNVPDHALCAVKAAWDMKIGASKLQGEILEKYGVDLQFGIGVNTGDAVVGNMGSDFRMDYTAIGDTINTAARLESNAGKGQIIISDATYQLVKDHVEVEELGEMHFKNKSVGILVYSVVGIKDGGN